MGNRKNLHNKNAVRVIRSNNSDSTGYDKMFKIQLPVVPNSATNASFNYGNLFTNYNGTEAETVQFNAEFRTSDNSEVIGSFDHNGDVIDNINVAYKAAAIKSDFVLNADLVSATQDFNNNQNVIIYIKGQFGQIAISGDATLAQFDFSDDLTELTDVEIMQWGRMNECNNWERMFKAVNGNNVKISASDEPVFAQGISLNRAFEDTTNNVMTAEALESVNSWDSNKFGNGGRVFENGSDQPNFDMWSQNGGASAYAYYMRNNMSGLTNGGANMVPVNVNGWAGYASDSFSNSFQGATGIHNWEKMNFSQVEEAQYFAWQNTRAKSLGTMEDISIGKCKNFTAMFGHAGNTDFGAEGELLVDPSNWDFGSAETLFFAFAMDVENKSNWAGELNWKTMRNVIDIHSVVKNRNNYTGARLDEFAPYSGNVVLFRSAFAGTAINYDFSKWNFSGVDATRTDVQLNENNASGIMGGFVRNCPNMSPENTVKLLEAWDRPFGQGGLPVSGVDAQIGSAAQEIGFGTTYQTREANGEFVMDAALEQRGQDAVASLQAKGYTITGLDFLQ